MLFFAEIDWNHVDAYVQAWAAVDPTATGVMQTDDEVRYLVKTLPAPLFRSDDQMEGDKLQEIAGTYRHQTTIDFSLPTIRSRC